MKKQKDDDEEEEEEDDDDAEEDDDDEEDPRKSRDRESKGKNWDDGFSTTWEEEEVALSQLKK